MGGASVELLLFKALASFRLHQYVHLLYAHTHTHRLH